MEAVPLSTVLARALEIPINCSFSGLLLVFCMRRGVGNDNGTLLINSINGWHKVEKALSSADVSGAQDGFI